MPPRLRRTAAKKVDYTKFVQDDDDEDGSAPVSEGNGNQDNRPKARASADDDDEDDFQPPPDEVDDDGDVDMDDADDVDDELVKPKKKPGRKPKPKTEKPVKQTPKKDVRNSRGLSSLKDRTLRLFGYNEEKLKDVIRLRTAWQSSMFQVSGQVVETSATPTFITAPVVKAKPLTKVQLSKQFPVSKDPISVQVGSEETQNIAHGAHIARDKLIIANTGLLITDSVWLSVSQSSTSQYLLVAVSNITKTAISDKFSLLARNAYVSGFQIYKFDTETKDITLHKTILHPWGNAWDLKSLRSSTALGALSAVFNDGDARVINLGDDGADICELTSASLTYHLDSHIISTMDIQGNRAVCGTDTGYVAEFTLTDSTPSYVLPIHESYIFSLRLSNSPYDEPVFYTSCSDGTTAMACLEDIQSTITRTGNSKHMSKSVAYVPPLHSFVLSEGTSSAKVIPIRAEFAGPPVSSHDGTVETMGVSALHPMLLTGGSDGRLKITNMMRRMLNARKSQSSDHKVLTLIELQYGKSADVYRVIEPFTVEAGTTLESSGLTNIYPPEVNFTTCSWNGNASAPGLFAAGTTGGLLFVGML